MAKKKQTLKQALTCVLLSNRAGEGEGEGDGEEGLLGEISCALRIGDVGDSGFFLLALGLGVDDWGRFFTTGRGTSVTGTSLMLIVKGTSRTLIPS